MKSWTLLAFFLTLAACTSGGGGGSSQPAQNNDKSSPYSGPFPKIYQLVASEAHNCALDDFGVECWGSDFDGESTGIPPLDHPSKIAVGWRESCAIDKSGLHCWGNDNMKQISSQPALSNVTQIAIGNEYMCAIDDSGVRCWGNDSDKVVSTAPKLDHPTEISAGYEHACAIDKAGVHCWGGDDKFGQLSKTPSNLKNPRQIIAAELFSCVLADDGVHCWGYDSAAVMKAMPALKNVKQIAVRGMDVCALDDSGIRCWGTTSGQDNFWKAGRPVAHPTAFAAGRDWICELGVEGVYCYGDVYSSDAIDDLPFDTLGLSKRPVKVSPNAGKIPSLTGPEDEMSYSDAKAYCKNQGKRLPTAREMATWAASVGAKGILEVGMPIPDRSYQVVIAEDEDFGPVDKFYYSAQGFPKTNADSYWTSSQLHRQGIYGFDKYDGSISANYGGLNEHVFCTGN